MKKPFKNERKESFIASIPKEAISSQDYRIASQCKFNFAYYDGTQGLDISRIPIKELQELFCKLREYSKQSLSYWQNQRIGSGNQHVFEIYDKFPKISDFTHPLHVPHDACWARFRLQRLQRLVGFVIPEYIKQAPKCPSSIDTNTFYVVFYDDNHGFYKSGK